VVRIVIRYIPRREIVGCPISRCNSVFLAHVFNALLEVAASVESSLDLWTLADLFFRTFRPEYITECFESQLNHGFEAKVAWRIEALLFRVTEAAAIMIGDVMHHQTALDRMDTSTIVFNSILQTSLGDSSKNPKKRLQGVQFEASGTETSEQLLISAFEKCVECAQLAQQKQTVAPGGGAVAGGGGAVAGAGGAAAGGGAGRDDAETRIAQAEMAATSAADSISNAAFQTHQRLCVARLDALVNFIATLHSRSNPQLLSLNKLLRNIAINGRYRSITQLLGSHQQLLHLEAQNTSLLDVVCHLCDVKFILSSHADILSVAQQNRANSTLLLAQVRSCRITLRQVCSRV
jgi:hypothetical protein